MKYLILPVLFAFASLTTNAQLSANNYDLKSNESSSLQIADHSLSTSQITADAQGSDFYKKRRKGKKKSSPLGFGIITGGSMFSVSGDGVENVKMKFGMQFGLFGVYQINEMFGVKTGFIYTQKGFKYEEEMLGIKFDLISNFNYLNIPILATVGFGESVKIYANAGPVVGIFMSGKNTSDGVSEDIEDGIKSTDMGLLVGGGAIIPIVQSRKMPTISIIADVNYQLGLADINDIEGAGTLKNNGITFGVGIMVGGF
ncbi:MAG: PorT family protein [Bacteroidales bacterium]|nr:PorT family protein [Bacteroidales bacterium]MCF8454926.1 PorT family protein [Bacteroidales bacterium]